MSDAVEITQRSIYEYVSTVTGRLRFLTLGENRARVSEVLARALTAYVTLDAPTAVEPPWPEALWVTGISKAMSGFVERSLDDPKVKKTYTLLRMAALVYRRLYPDKALDLMRQAKALLPPNNVRQAESYYRQLVDLLEDSGKLTEAIAAQKEAVQLTGHGGGRLLVLQVRNKDDDGFQETFNLLQAPDADEQDVVQAGAMLIQLNSTKYPQSREQGVALLESYLAAKRNRDVVQELNARLTLAQFFVIRRQWPEAKAALSIENLKPPFASRLARNDYAAAQEMLKQIDSQINAQSTMAGQGEKAP
jgi:hypothetical protein